MWVIINNCYCMNDSLLMFEAATNIQVNLESTLRNEFWGTRLLACENTTEQ